MSVKLSAWTLTRRSKKKSKRYTKTFVECPGCHQSVLQENFEVHYKEQHT